MESDKQEARWVLRAQSGDRDAVESLLQALEAPLFAYLRRLLRDPSLAEDALQETLIAVFRKIRWLRDPRFFRAWAYRIASRKAFRAIRRETGRAEDPLEDGTAGAIADLGAGPEGVHAAIERLPDLVQGLPPASRAVVELHYRNDMTIQEVAAVLEVPAGTVKSRLAYALAVLRRRLGEEGGAPPTRRAGGDA